MLLVMSLHGSEGEESRSQVLGLPQRLDAWSWGHPALLQETASPRTFSGIDSHYSPGMVEGLLPVTEGQQEGQSSGLGNQEPDSRLGSINNRPCGLGQSFPGLVLSFLL